MPAVGWQLPYWRSLLIADGAPAVEATGAEEDRDQLHEILVSGVRLAGDATDRLDLKIANAALKEMRTAFKAFARALRYACSKDRRLAKVLPSTKELL